MKNVNKKIKQLRQIIREYQQFILKILVGKHFKQDIKRKDVKTGKKKALKLQILDKRKC